MARRKGNKVGESLERDGVAIPHGQIDGLGKGQETRHAASPAPENANFITGHVRKGQMMPCRRSRPASRSAAAA